MKRFVILFLVLICSAAMCMTAVCAENTRDFTFENSLALSLKELGLFSGVSDTDFDLERAPSRIEVLVMLIRVLGEEKAALDGGFEHPFTDVPSWADPYVGYAYEKGLTKGISKTEFGGGRASAATYLTFMLRALGYSDAAGDFKWDAPYSLAKGLGLLPRIVDTDNFLRADIVTVSYAALSAELNNSTLLLSEKLIEKGVFDIDTFNESYIASKLTDKENENKIALNAEQIYEDYSGAVFYIEIQTKEGTPLASGSGFFIDESGIAVTNWHVIQRAQKAVVTLSGSGKKFDVGGVYYYSQEHDIAVIKVNGSGFKTLEINPMPVKGASSVYAIGSPKGFQNTISQGIISNTRRIVDGNTYIQTTAPISNGSSGGVLLNSYGEAIGITSAGYDDAQNLNFARPITYLATAKLENAVALDEVNWNHIKYVLDSYEYTVEAGTSISFEFDASIGISDQKTPEFIVKSSDTEVAVAVPLFNDTFVGIVGVSAGTATVTLSDNVTNDSVTFTVNVTEGKARKTPYVEYFTRFDKLALNKGAEKTICVSAVEIGGSDELSLNIISENSQTAKVTNFKVGEKYVTADVKAVKNGSTEIIISNNITEDKKSVSVDVEEQFYNSFDTVKNYLLENGTFKDLPEEENDYYYAEFVASNDDIPLLIYYPKTNKLCMRLQSMALNVYFEIILTEESATSGKNVGFLIYYPMLAIRATGRFSDLSGFGDGKNDSIIFDEFTGAATVKDNLKRTMPGAFVAMLYVFDTWFSYILPDVEATDFGFISLDYGAYGLKLQYEIAD